MPLGSLAIVLHAHLPYVRHPEHPRFFEEQWFFEALADCYLPLLQRFEQWSNDQLPWKLTLSLSPTLAAQLEDPLLLHRFEAYCESRLELAARESQRNLLRPERAHLARLEQTRRAALLQQLPRLLPAFNAALQRFARQGNLELITTAATHGFLPLLLKIPAAVHLQIHSALLDFHRRFQFTPSGFWLPECAYTESLEPFLLSHGVRWTLLDTSAFCPSSPSHPLVPTQTPSGLVVFPRDPHSAHQVWSRTGGYPGDPRYREFHRDLSSEADWHYIRPYLPGTTMRVDTGLKFHAIGSPHLPKPIYNPSAALEAAHQHAAHFLQQRAHHLRLSAESTATHPILVAPFDAELFGHWWHEGLDFLDAVVRGACMPSSPVHLTTPQHWLTQHGGHLKTSHPKNSSWGEGGDWRVWQNRTVDWMSEQLAACSQRLEHVAQTPLSASAEIEPRLHAALQHWLLAQSSDWAFMQYFGTAGDYPRDRFLSHLHTIDALLAPTDPNPELVAKASLPFLASLPLTRLFGRVGIGQSYRALPRAEDSV